METFVLTVIVLSGALCVFLLMMASSQILSNYRKKESKDWDVGDTVRIATRSGSKSARLAGWCESYVYYIDGGHAVRLRRLWVLYNRSALWRRSYNKCRGYMGRKPAFDSKAAELGPDIECMSKEECLAYLNNCLISEDYETADLIRKRIEKLG